MTGVQVQEVAQAAKLDHSDSAGSSVRDQSMQRTSTSFKNRSGFRGVRRVCHKTLLVCWLTKLFSNVLCFLNYCACDRRTMKAAFLRVCSALAVQRIWHKQLWFSDCFVLLQPSL